MTTRTANLISEVEAYLKQFMAFPNADHPRALAMWVMGTHLWQHFDAFPYLVITSDTKRSGKTRLSELLSFLCKNSRSSGAMTAAVMYRTIQAENPTLFIDEAESLSSEGVGMMRSVLNMGYRRGQTVGRTGPDGDIVQWPVYCPKVFVLIGDVNDTLRDRAIVITLRRGEAPMRFVYEAAKNEGAAIREKIAFWAAEQALTVAEQYQRHPGLSFLTDRDEELWLPLFAIMDTMAPELAPDFQRVAVDLATAKTQEKRTVSTLLGAERQAEEDEYARHLLRDMVTVLGSSKYVLTTDALPALKAIPTAPWRVFRGDGLSDRELSALLDRYSLSPKNIKVGKGSKGAVRRGYSRKDILAAAASAGVTA